MNDVKRIENDPGIKTIVIVVEGGVGKVIASTGVIKALAERFPDKRIVTISGYPDIYEYSSHIYRNFNFNNTINFYDDYYVERQDTYMIRYEPYVDYDYIVGKKHITQVWANAIGLEDKIYKPYMRFLDTEILAAKDYVKKNVTGKKKFALIQWVGGMIPQDQSELSFADAQVKMQRRSMRKDTIQHVVNKLTSRDYVIGTVQHINHPKIEGTIGIFFPIRAVILLLQHADLFIGIASFLQHASALEGMEKSGYVYWGGNDPRNLGWEHNVNVSRTCDCKTPFCNRPNSHLHDRSVNGMWNCPYNDECMNFPVDKILKDVGLLEDK